jgi:putative transposase
MARKSRFSPGNLAYHVMNRVGTNLELFQDADDYEAFEKVLGEALKREPTMRLCANCLMPNHYRGKVALT